MLNSRRLWILGPVLAALVLLLALSRGAGREVQRAAPANETRTAVAGAESRAAAPAAAAVEEASGPRHPELGFRGRERLTEHFAKHGREVGARSAGEYLRMAQTLRDRPKGPDVLGFVRNDAVTCKFERSSGTFVAYNSDGTLRTFFRPNDGVAYFERQKSRAHEAP